MPKTITLYGTKVDAADYNKLHSLCRVLIGVSSISEPLPHAQKRALRIALQSLAEMRNDGIRNPNIFDNCVHGVIQATCTKCWPKGNIIRK